MLENRRLRLVIIMILVGAVVAATLAMPLWIEQITGTTRPEESSKDPFYTPTSEFDNIALTDNVGEATSTPTNTPPPPKTGENNCVRDISSWLSHQDSWPFEEIRIANRSFSKAEVVLIIGSSTQDPVQLVLGQLFVYTLNIQNVTDHSLDMEVIVDAHKWLNDHPAGGVVTEQDQELAYELVHVLSEFNQGILGPGLCSEMTDTPAPTPTPTPTQTEIPTVTSTATATPTKVVTLPPEFYTPVPDGRPKPDKTKPPREPTEPPPEPTEPPPEPTEPPPPPVEPTQQPPPTAVPTKIELPTAAPTSEP